MSNDKILGVEVAGPRESVKWARQKFEECMSGLKEITSNEALADKLCALNAVPDITDPSTLGSVILAQLALTKLGYRPGTIDGLYRNSGAKTSKTMAAVEKFQTDKGLTASGRVDAETLATLAEALRSTAIVVGSDTRRGVSPAAEPVAPVPLTAPPVPRVMSESLPPAPAVRTASVTTKTNNAAVAVGELDPGHETTLGLTVSVNIPPASGNQGVDTRVETQYTPEQNYRIGESIILGNGNMEDARRGMKFLETAAKAWHLQAQSLAGGHYAFGTRVAADYAKALSYLSPAAEAGDANAQNNLAAMMYFGLGMRQDLAGALKWAKASAAQGVEPAKKLQGIIEEKMREPALTPALERGGNPLSELPKSASMERLDAVMDNVRMRRDAGKKYGLPWESDQTVVLDAVRQLVKRGENAKANGLIAMSRQIMANAAGEQETIYGKFGRELARLEASASKSGTGRSTRAR